MKILYVTTISNTVNAFLIPHIKMLTDQGHDVDVAFNIEQPVNKEIYDLGCKVFEIGFRRSPFDKRNLKAYKDLRKIIEDGRYELVHTHTPVASVCSRIACMNLQGVKVFYTAHGFHFYKGAPLKNWLIYYPIEKLLSKHTDVLIAINKEDYEIACKKLHAKSTCLINGVGIDLKKFIPQTSALKTQMRNHYGFDNDEFILFYAGELSYRKHQDLLIEAVCLLADSIPEIRLVLAGTGECENQYKELANKLGIGEKVKFIGYRNDIANLMLTADIAVSSSRQEGLPVNVMEAMASGLPIVVTDCRGNRDLVQNGKNGYVVRLDDPKSFKDSIKKIYTLPGNGSKFSRNNLEIIDNYSIGKITDEMKNLYEFS